MVIFFLELFIIDFFFFVKVISVFFLSLFIDIEDFVVF